LLQRQDGRAKEKKRKEKQKNNKKRAKTIA
jgi:hypothetical protein